MACSVEKSDGPSALDVDDLQSLTERQFAFLPNAPKVRGRAAGRRSLALDSDRSVSSLSSCSPFPAEMAAAAAPPAETNRMHKKVAPFFNRLLKALLREELFEFDVSMLDELAMRKKLMGERNKKISTNTCNGRAKATRRLMDGVDRRCPDFAQRLRHRLEAARAEREANPPPVLPPEPPTPTNTEPSDMRYGYYYPMEEEGAPIEFSTTNSHREAYGSLADGDDRSAKFLVNGAPIRFLYAEVDQLDAQLLASLLTSLLELSRRDHIRLSEFVRRTATTESPEPFKTFLKDIIGKPEFVSEQLMREAFASLPEGQGGVGTAERLVQHLCIASGLRVNACQNCRKWWLTNISSFCYDELTAKQPLPRFPFRRTNNCPWCGDLVDSNDRLNRYSFVATKKKPRKLYKLSCILSAHYYCWRFVKRTLTVSGNKFRCGAATFVTGDGRSFTLVLANGDDEQDEVIDHARPFAVLTAEQRLLVPKGYVACLVYIIA